MLRNSQLLSFVLAPVVALIAIASVFLWAPFQGLFSPKAGKQAAKPASVTKPAERQAAKKQQARKRATEKKPQTPKYGVDVARIDPEGTSVIAGLAKPSEHVTLMVNGVAIGSVKADKYGEWVFVTDHKFATPTPRITLKYGVQPQPKLASAKALPAKSPQVEERKPPLSRAATLRPQKTVARARQRSTTLSAKAVTTEQMRRLQALADEKSTTAAGSGIAGAPRGSVRYSTASSSTAGATLSTAQRTAAGLPIPIKFRYRNAEFTKQGFKAASLLLKYLKAKNFKSVSLTGHADERGSERQNMRLSRERLQAIERFLRAGGYAGELKLIPMGASERFAGVDRSKYSARDLWELDRRVELKAAN